MSKTPSCCEPSEPETASCHAPKGRARIDILFWGSLTGVGFLFALAVLSPAWVIAYPWLNTMTHTVHQMIYAMWWGVVMGVLFVGVLTKIPRDFIMAILGQGGSITGLLRATGAGVMLDLCSHGILMVAAKLYERGASAGQIMAFLLASPWNSFSLTLILIGLIGLHWTALFTVLSMVIALSTGWIFDRLVAYNILPANRYEIAHDPDFRFWSEAKAGLKQASFNIAFFRDILISGIKDSKMVVRWLLFGILLAAILRALFAPEQFEQFFGPSLLGLLVTVFVATILEVCSEGATPIAADILTRAKAPGNGFAFLMAGVATDYTEIMVLKDTTKSWRLALFLPLITVPQVLLVGWLINRSVSL